MINLILMDGTTYEVANNSTITDIMVVVADYAEVDAMIPHFTKANMEKVELGEDTYYNVIPTGVSVSGTDSIVAHFTTRNRTTDEIVLAQAEQINELQEVVAALLEDDEEPVDGEEE